jgi:T4 RnlA family RNA ligase
MKLSDMQQALARDEIRIKTEVVNEQQVHIVTYMVASPDLWDVPNAIEARGITFDNNGNCICRTMEKFFNINENKFSQLDNLNFTDAIAYDKLDGSMISVVDIDSKLFCKTKKSFYSPIAIAAQKYFDTHKSIQELSKYLIEEGYTPTFEYESIENQIVVTQTIEKMTFLLARNIVTGQYLELQSMINLSEFFNVPIPGHSIVTNITNLITLATEAKEIEGWVINLSSGQRVKLKTDWYSLRHKLTDYSERNIFDLVLSEKIDDLMPLLETREGAVAKVNNISHRIAYLMKQAEIDSDHLVNLWINSNLSLPEIGKQFSQHKVFPLAIKQFKNQEPDFKLYVINHYRNTFSTIPLFWGFNTDV